MAQFFLHCSYKVPSFFGLDEDKDKRLEKIVGKESDGSGSGHNLRDISWYFTRSNQATEAFTKLSTVAKKMKLVQLDLERAD